MARDRQAVNRELESVKAQEAALQEELEALSVSVEEAELADILHSRLCTWNHTDGCSWSYETHGTDLVEDSAWERPSHSKWLERSRFTLLYTDTRTVLLVLDAVNGKTPKGPSS